MKSPLVARIEDRLRRLRSYVDPRMVSCYLDLAARECPPGAGQAVLFDFRSSEIDQVMGRYLFHLVRDFHALGFRLVYARRYGFLATVRHKRYKRLLLDIPFHTMEGPELEGETFLYVTDHPTHSPEGAGRILRIVYDKRRKTGDAEFEFPFFVHPRISLSAGFPPEFNAGAERPMKLFFAGNTRDAKYSGGAVREVFGMLPRNEVLRLVREHLTEQNVREIATEAELDVPSGHAFQLAETARFGVPSERWIETMRRADFFLCGPGAAMPLCHNLIEALACGTIPILQYQRYLDPELRDGENCLSFNDRPSLARSVDRALQMKQDDLQRLRGGARAYFDAFLREGAFVRRVLDAPHREVSILLNAYRVPR